MLCLTLDSRVRGNDGGHAVVTGCFRRNDGLLAVIQRGVGRLNLAILRLALWNRRVLENAFGGSPGTRPGVGSEALIGPIHSRPARTAN